MSPMALMRDLVLDKLTVIEDGANVICEAGQENTAGEVRDRAASVAREYIENAADRRREASNDKVFVEKNGRDLGAIE